MFRLDDIWWCDSALENCAETAGLFEGQLELDDDCLVIQALPADEPGSVRMVYVGYTDERWDPVDQALVWASGDTLALGEPFEFMSAWLDVDTYIESHHIGAAPQEFRSCAERIGGLVFNRAPWDIVGQ